MENKKQHYQITTKHGVFTVAIWYNERDKAYLARALKLPDVITCGKTLAQAKRMAKDALELYCSCVVERGKVIIDDMRKVIGQIPRSNAGIFSVYA